MPFSAASIPIVMNIIIVLISIVQSFLISLTKSCEWLMPREEEEGKLLHKTENMLREEKTEI